MLRRLVVMGLIFSAGLVRADVKPLWDLTKDKIPAALQSGKIERQGNLVTLKDGAAFAVPATAFPDQKNFTVDVTASLLKLIDPSEFTVMKKQDKDDNGFTYSINFTAKPWWARKITSVVNNVFMYSTGIGGQQYPKTNHPYKFTVAVRNGLATFYIDDKPVKKCYMPLIPNNEPMWIGRNLKKSRKYLPVTISSVKVYGPDYKYISTKEPKAKYPRGVVAGNGWALDIPKIDHPDWPKVLFYGDSISVGYSRFFIRDLLKHNVYAFHCTHFVKGEVPKPVIEEMSGRFKFDVVVFNNGLHSLHWTPDKVSDQVIYNRMRDLAQSIKKGAPQAKIFYLLTTPHTAKRPAPGQPVNALGDKNDIVQRLNRISIQVMKAENIPVIDVYTPLTKHLDWARGDGYHWNAPAYKFIAKEIEKNILKSLPEK